MASKSKYDFNGSDIEKYHRGELTEQEMYALEKAAMEDDFLADALEGYAFTNTSQIDLKELRSKLSNTIASKKNNSTPKLSFYWHRIAALFILIIGAGYLIFLLSEATDKKIAVENVPVSNKTLSSPEEDASSTTVSADSTYIATEALPVETNAQQEIRKPSKKIQDQKNNHEGAELQRINQLSNEVSSINPGIELKEDSVRNKIIMSAVTGKVVDNKGKPIPFASIRLAQSSVVVNADHKGNFKINIPDTAVEATVSAVGYDNSSMELISSTSENKIVLNENNAALNEVVVTGYSSKNKKNAQNRLEEYGSLEPADGWNSFDDYIISNIKVPEKLEEKQLKGEVRLSFEVDSNGAPINIKIEKSLCQECDKEAIRLLQEGPKWKRKKGKRGRVNIRFQT